ncbi:site-specific integrase [Caulobacter segnis]|uniref:Integrase family protein n=2 Tax=Caulobacter segnis TaxID=88688 RepID=D5VLN7_CAUST|nr:site-specific integrase [Caulobacter segnis]ADG11410.1 integrase family protein [Caulobacter segnis ATCC 21756]AVQ03078.1 site-specific integrase [Caulobacter segnis]
MPRPAQGPRLYLRTGRIDPRTKLALPDVYVIRDGSTQKSTGCGPDRLREAQLAFARYLAGQAVRASAADLSRPSPGPLEPIRDRSEPIPVAEVLALYAQERAPELASSPVTMAGFIRALLSFWSDKFVEDVKRSTCKAYVQYRAAQSVKGAQPGARLVSEQTARRELEVLSAAIGYWHAETPLSVRPKVWLPPRAESPRDALTRGQAAALLLAARGYRRGEDGVMRRLTGSQRENRAHLARFILIGLYTGTRSAAIRALLWEPSATQAWVDLDRGMIYRKGLREREHANKRRPIARLPRRLLAHLRRWRALDARASTVRSQPLDHVLHHGGAPIATKVNKGFDAIARDAGLEDVTPHWLRHTCATWLMESGVDLWEAAAYTGMTPAVLLKHYGHHRPDHHAAARSAFTTKRAA